MSTPKDIEKAIRDALHKIGDPQIMKEIGEEASEMVRVRTRLGYGVKAMLSKRERLKPLADSTKEYRMGKYAYKKMQRANGSYYTVRYPVDLDENKVKLSEFTKPFRSNLTLTGQMLESFKPVSISHNKVVIGPTGTREDGLTNEEVAEFAEIHGRPFAYLTDIEYKRIIDSVRKRLTKLAQTILTKL